MSRSPRIEYLPQTRELLRACWDEVTEEMLPDHQGFFVLEGMTDHA